MCIVHLSVIVRGHKVHSGFCKGKISQTTTKNSSQYLWKAASICRVFVLISLSLKDEKGMDLSSHTDSLGSVSLCLRTRHILTLNPKFSQYSNYSLYFNSPIYCDESSRKKKVFQTLKNHALSCFGLMNCNVLQWKLNRFPINDLTEPSSRPFPTISAYLQRFLCPAGNGRTGKHRLAFASTSKAMEMLLNNWAQATGFGQETVFCSHCSGKFQLVKVSPFRSLVHLL